MPGYSTYSTDTTIAPKGLGYPLVTTFESASTALSASANTVFDWTSASGISLNTPGYTSIPVGCGWSVTDPSSGNFVNYGQYVTQNMPNMGNLGNWWFQLVIPPNPSTPNVIVKAYLFAFPTVAFETI